MDSLQKKIFQNKVDKDFNTTNVALEFCYLQGEVAEAFAAYEQKKQTVGEELADIAIYLYGLAEMLGYDLNTEIMKKVEINKKRVYKKVNGVNKRIR